MHIKKNPLFLIIGLLIGQFSFAQSTKQLELLDAYYAKSMKEWHIPGMAIAIVSHDSIVFAKGYGYADLTKKKEVDEHTLFAIASNTKAFTASAIAQLVEQGKLKWSDKVINYLPYFELYDPYVSRNMTIEDLLCHRSGLKTFSGDLLWYGSDKNPEDIVKSAKELKQVHDFRVEFGYSNIMYIAAGLVIEAISHDSWNEYIQKHFLNPLKMNRTLTSTTGLEGKQNVAQPYYYSNGENKKLDWLNWDNVAAAGGLISSVSDMSNWLILNINRGSFADSTFFTAESFEKLTTPHINFSINSYTRKNHPSKHFSAYGLGWAISDKYGRKIISHGGGYDGMISKSWLVPEDKLGMIILTNNLNYLPGALMEKTVDVLLGNVTEGPDYAAMYLMSNKYNGEQIEGKLKAIEQNRKKINPNHLPFENYTGLYRDEMYGAINVWKEDDLLFFQMIPTKIFHAPLKHWNDHIFTFQFPPELSSLPPGKLWFDLDKRGVPTSLHIDIPNPDFDFMEFEFRRVGK